MDYIDEEIMKDTIKDVCSLMDYVPVEKTDENFLKVYELFLYQERTKVLDQQNNLIQSAFVAGYKCPSALEKIAMILESKL